MTELLNRLAVAIKRAICASWGHRKYSGWWGDGLYGDVRGGGADGIGRTHYTVWNTCDRCGDRYITARFHGEAIKIKESERADNG